MLRNSGVLLGVYFCLSVAQGASTGIAPYGQAVQSDQQKWASGTYGSPYNQVFESDQQKWAENSNNYEELMNYYHVGEDDEESSDNTESCSSADKPKPEAPKPEPKVIDDAPSCSLEGIPMPPMKDPVMGTDPTTPQLPPMADGLTTFTAPAISLVPDQPVAKPSSGTKEQLKVDATPKLISNQIAKNLKPQRPVEQPDLKPAVPVNPYNPRKPKNDLNKGLYAQKYKTKSGN